MTGNGMMTYRIELFGPSANPRVTMLIWQGSRRPMVSDDFRSGLSDFAAVIEAVQPIGMLIDTRDFDYKPTSDDRDWRDTNITPKYNESGVQRCAYVVSAIPENPNTYSGASFETCYFDDLELAQSWLLG